LDPSRWRPGGSCLRALGLEVSSEEEYRKCPTTHLRGIVFFRDRRYVGAVGLRPHPPNPKDLAVSEPKGCREPCGSPSSLCSVAYMKKAECTRLYGGSNVPL
jgi:hypothetical protein